MMELSPQEQHLQQQQQQQVRRRQAGGGGGDEAEYQEQEPLFVHATMHDDAPPALAQKRAEAPHVIGAGGGLIMQLQKQDPSNFRLVASSGGSAAFANEKREVQPWRVRDRMKTVSVALFLCLNIGVDPPDVVKPDPCARLECWINPYSLPPQKALDSIAKSLQLQYERWQPRARYKTATDPTVDEVKKLCMASRKTAKEERVLFHYNGHGVPRPTPNGEIWVFNKNYTQYIPLSVYDLQTWMDTPSIYVFDCSGAGLIVSAFKQFALQREAEQQAWSLAHQNSSSESGSHEQQQQLSQRGRASEAPRTGQHREQLRDQARNDSASSRAAAAAAAAAAGAAAPPVRHSSFRDCILLAACQGNEVLPTNPDLPADLFTSCLTTPIKTAVRWFAPRSLLQNVNVELLDRIPGRLNDRKTPLGELNWIFTAITDTIAWNVLPRPLFKRLFRQDLLVASLFRNFLLAERILWSANCTPISEPALPPTHNHHLWQAWDYTVEQCLAQLPALLAAEEQAISRMPRPNPGPQPAGVGVGSGAGSGVRVAAVGVATNGAAPRLSALTSAWQAPMAHAFATGSGVSTGTHGSMAESLEYQYTSNPFFEDQMTAFEVWLSMGPQERNPPEQLPIVLQVLLSQVHRLRALRLLSRFLQMGSWAIDLALSVGIFPYVLKLLQSPAAELRQELVFIWGKILALDRSCQVDLVKDNGHVYFIEFLGKGYSSSSSSAVHVAMAAFVLSTVASDAPEKCASDPQFVTGCLRRLSDPHPLVRRWCLFCLSQFIAYSSEYVDDVYRNPELLQTVFDLQRNDPFPEVRAAASILLGNAFIGTYRYLSLQAHQFAAALASSSQSRADDEFLQPEDGGYSVSKGIQDSGRDHDGQQQLLDFDNDSGLQNVLDSDGDEVADDLMRKLGALPDPRIQEFANLCLQMLDHFATTICDDEASPLCRREVALISSRIIESRAAEMAALLDARVVTASRGVREQYPDGIDMDTREAGLAASTGMMSGNASSDLGLDRLIMMRLWSIINVVSSDAHPVIAFVGYECVSLVESLLPKDSNARRLFLRSCNNASNAPPGLQPHGKVATGGRIGAQSAADRLKDEDSVHHGHDSLPRVLSFEAVGSLFQRLFNPNRPQNSIHGIGGDLGGSSAAGHMHGQGGGVKGPGARSFVDQWGFDVSTRAELQRALAQIPSLYEWSCREILSIEMDMDDRSSSTGGMGMYEASVFAQHHLAHGNHGSMSMTSPVWSSSTTLSVPESPPVEAVLSSTTTGSFGGMMPISGAAGLAVGSMGGGEHQHHIAKMDEVASFETMQGGIWSMAFAEHHPLLAMGTSTGTVMVFDIEKWSKKDILGVPRLKDSLRYGVTSLSVTGAPCEEPVYACSSADGQVALWRKDQVSERVFFLSAFHAASRTAELDLLNVQQSYNRLRPSASRLGLWARSNSTSSSQNPAIPTSSSPSVGTETGYGCAMHWSGMHEYMITGGCERSLVRLWDMHTETCAWKSAVLSEDAFVASVLGGDPRNEYMRDAYVVGGSDGSLVVLDSRTQGGDGRVTVAPRAHKVPVVALGVDDSRASRIGERQLLYSADFCGLVNVWDFRMMGRGVIRSINAHPGKLTSMVVRPVDHSPLITGSANRSIKFLSSTGDVRKEIKFHEGFLSTRIGPVTSLAYNPGKSMLAAGFGDSIVSFYGGT
ncbi:Regulatory-associated protein of mTOR [Porphyridium purpureum]|uniref:Regulatory-associated protein of mTOR n=1 Tax=Porphyridium purpureum TaxID=35688 RepID=A0A5J4YRC8_PORPP|nr:Regulatory-associated protein of mTOR [Porphyridium purpureum]|eukprot:POR3346..scf229_5